MQDNLEILRKGWREEGDRWPEIVHNMQNRIGISSGQMVTGNMGSESRMNYTMMGDNVNTVRDLNHLLNNMAFIFKLLIVRINP